MNDFLTQVTTGKLDLPHSLRCGVGATPDGRAWLGRLPQLVDDAVRRWGLVVGPPFDGGSAAWTAPAVVRGGPWAGRDVVVKLSYPHEEAAGEATGLQLWAGRGAVTLLDRAGWSLLLQRCMPGVTLAADQGPEEERLLAGAAALRQLYCASDAQALTGLPVMAEVCRVWAEQVNNRAQQAAVTGALRVDPVLLAEATTVLVTFPGAGRSAVVHGDANPGNLLRDAAGWVWIDPKPMVGDPAYDPWPLLEQVGDPFEAPDPVTVLGERTRLVAQVAGLDPVRVARWATARSVEAALWEWAVCADAAGAKECLTRARIWADVASKG